MAQRILIKVVGFTDVERHALNTVFRLSEDGPTQYVPWTPEEIETPELLLIDGQSYEGRVEAESPANASLRKVWVGDAAPPDVWRTFERPLAWHEVVASIDALYAPAVDLDIDFGETRPPEPEVPRKRALIASADRDQRLYLRAKLSLADLTQADEAESAAQALELLRAHHYEVALVDFGLPGADGWRFARQLRATQPAVPHLIITKAGASWGDHLRAWLAGLPAFYGQPPHPAKLQQALQKV
jgi:CheY-like chemotaxis protein